MKEFNIESAWEKYHNEDNNCVTVAVHPTLPSDMDTGWADHITWKTPKARENFLQQLTGDKEFTVMFLVDTDTGEVELMHVAIG